MFKLFVLLNPIYISLFWALVLNFNKPKDHTPKVFLGKFMLIAFLLYCCHFTYYYPFPEIYHYLDAFYHLCSQLLFPMYYIYIRLLTIDNKFSFKKHSVFLIFPIIMSTLLAIGIFNMSKEEHIWFVYEKIDITHLNGIFFYQKVIAIMLKQTFMLQGVLYLILSFRLIKENKENIQNYYANTTDATLEKANTLNISLIFAIGAGIILSLIGKERFIQHDVALFFPSIVVSIILFTIGFLGNKQQSVLTTEETQENETETKTTEYGNEQLILIREKIQTLFEKEKIYLNKDLTIWELSRTIGTNRTYISNIINNEYNQNFSTFVNSYRVKFAQKLILKNPNMSNQDLAELSGFGSVVSMQRSFQMLEGKTIKQFKEQSPENYEI